MTLPIRQAIDHLQSAKREIDHATERITADLRATAHSVAESLDGLDPPVADRCRLPWSEAVVRSIREVTDGGETAKLEMDRTIAALEALL